MSAVDLPKTVGQWVAEHPAAARVFEELQIDYCCGGNVPLADVCEAMGLDFGLVASKLNDPIIQSDDDSPHNFVRMPLSELCDHIETTHHAFLKTELLRLTQLVEKVADVHGAGHPELHDVRSVFAELRAELEPHMLKEEKILFPAIRVLEQFAGRPQFPFGTVANPIRMMEHEHDTAGNALKRLRELTQDFQAPDDACNTWRVMLDGLHHLETDLHQHIHKENNILFPRAERLDVSRSEPGQESSVH